ncbi:MAG: cobalt-precorrin 5A hydrolase [Moorellales bacterium]
MAGIAVVALTKRGRELAERIAAGLGERARVYPFGAAAPGMNAQMRKTKGALTAFLGELFVSQDALILVMATGVAVRCLAPHLRDKRCDPAVVVVGEDGRYVISLLSGHLGGANELAQYLARLIGGKPVITTASDLGGLPALDVVARDLGLVPAPEGRLARVAARLVNGARVGFWAEPLLVPDLEERLGKGRVHLLADFEGPEGWEAGVLVTDRRLPDFGPAWMFWRPRTVVVGVGCRRGVSARTVLGAVGRVLRSAGISRRSLRALATVDLKADEPGLVAAAARLRCPLLVFNREEVARVLGEDPQLVRSGRVQAEIGVGGVCEPCAKLGARGGDLIWPKTAYRGVTVAVARAGWR